MRKFPPYTAEHWIILKRGDSLQLFATLFVPGTTTLENFTGHTAIMQVRTNAGSGDVILELSTAVGNLVLGGAAGTVSGKVAASVMRTLQAGVYVYSVQFTAPTGDVRTRLAGPFIIESDVSRPA